MSKKKAPEPMPTPEEQGAFTAALLARPRQKTVSDTQDAECFRLLDALRNGHWDLASRQMEEIEKLYVHGSGCPSDDGFRNLMHVMRQLLGRAREPMVHLVAIGEDHDPETARKQ